MISPVALKAVKRHQNKNPTSHKKRWNNTKIKICHYTKKGRVKPTNIDLQSDKTMDYQNPPRTYPEPPHKTRHSHTRPSETQAGEHLPDSSRAKAEKHTTLLPQKSCHHLPTKTAITSPRKRHLPTATGTIHYSRREDSCTIRQHQPNALLCTKTAQPTSTPKQYPLPTGWADRPNTGGSPLERGQLSYRDRH